MDTTSGSVTLCFTVAGQEPFYTNRAKSTTRIPKLAAMTVQRHFWLSSLTVIFILLTIRLLPRESLGSRTFSRALRNNVTITTSRQQSTELDAKGTSEASILFGPFVREFIEAFGFLFVEQPHRSNTVR